MAGIETSEETFRVRVNLERFFGDERARCYVSVGGARRVRWLARRLRRLFPLPRRLALLSRGHLLPPGEPLALLRPDDPVEVIPATVVNEIDGDIQSATGDIIEASSPVPAEPSPSSKRTRKDQHLGANDTELPVEMDTSITLPVSAENDSQREESKELPQEELSGETSTDYKKSKKNEHLFYDSISKETNVVPTGSTDDIEIEQDSIQKPESDSERMRLLKERALAVLEQVAARPRRRARVRRRRRREPRPGDLEYFCPADSASPRPPEAARTGGSVASSPLQPLPEYLCPGADSAPARPPEAPALGPPVEPVPVMPRRDDDSAGEDATDASHPVPAPAAGDAASWQAGRAVPAVLRNPLAAPRAARLVHSLVNVAPV